ncbi:MAG TPA: FkbM family methyltransferase [Gemmatimonadaceae bacterium]
MPLLNTLRFILEHPLNQGHRIAALRRFAAWQVGSRLVSGPIAAEFVDGLSLLVSPGQTGATGNVYAGLHEVAEMAFVLHLLRKGDLFADIGANIGSYTILACAAGARCISFEPGPAADSLAANVRFNNLSSRVDVRRSAVGSTTGEVRFTPDEDTLNHVATSADSSKAIVVPLTTLDAALDGRIPALIKIDVEGFEKEVLDGAQRTLEDSSLLAVIVETNGSGARYGSSDAELHQRLTAAGLSPATYEPFSRALDQTQSVNAGGNTIYVRGLETVRDRVRTAGRFRLSLGREI